MARSKKTKGRGGDRPSQDDPTAPLDGADLLKAARPVLELLRLDLGKRAEDVGVERALRARYEAEKQAKRTADSFAEWQEGLLAQVAASWFLSCVFVRTLEDRGLLGQARLAGPGATDSQTLFDQLAPSLTERDYLLFVFRELAELPAAKALFDRDHALVWQLSPSADAAKELLRLFRMPSADAPAFRFGQASTRFLGDLYQDLYEDVRKRYALLQTPDFIESFILDRTLEPAIERFGLDDTTLIDPTCGSGHFLLGAFDRLFDHRLRAEPGIDVRQAAHKALDAVYGADINPYAVAIARVRLTLSYLEKAGIARVKDAPALPLHLVVADSLLHNPQHVQLGFEHQEGRSATEGWRAAAFQLEDEAGARDVLHRKYAAVVGNPPYITEKDSAKRETYRAMYPRSAAGKYALSAPFCERFFQLARERGSVGQITANSFMKREFGKKLVEDYLPSVNLELIVNTSGAYIPGHGTPTVLLFGTHEAPVKGEVLSVLAKRGEPSTPADPAKGAVWSSIAAHWREVGFDNDYVTVATTGRDKLAAHPWSLGGGGAVELKELLEERAEKRLRELADSVGIASFTLEDEVYLRPQSAWRRSATPTSRLRAMIIGEAIRDWAIGPVEAAFFPYDEQFSAIPSSSPDLKVLWPWRACLANNILFGGKTKIEGGLAWHEYGRLTADKLRTPLTITFAEVATHNHFVLDRGGNIFKQTAPIIKLPAVATEDDHLALLAYLNSSTACFWMKQVCFPKASAVKELHIGGMQEEDNRYAFSSTALLPLPIPPMAPGQRSRLGELAREALDVAAAREAASGEQVVEHVATGGDPADVELRAGAHLRRLVAIQEEIDWLVYGLFDLAPSSTSVSVNEADKDARPFLSPAADKQVAAWGVREQLTASSDELRLLESPNYKRLWTGRRGIFGHQATTFLADAVAAASARVQDVAELALGTCTAAQSIRELARAVGADPKVARLSSALLGGTDRIRDVLADGDAVPFLACLRLNDAGLGGWCFLRLTGSTGIPDVSTVGRHDTGQDAVARRPVRVEPVVLR